MLAMFVNDHKDDWDKHLPLLTMAYRSSVQKRTKCTPNILMLRRETSFSIDLITGPPSYSYDSHVKYHIKYVEWLKEPMKNAFDFAHKIYRVVFRNKSDITTIIKDKLIRTTNVSATLVSTGGIPKTWFRIDRALRDCHKFIRHNVRNRKMQWREK